MGATSIRQKWVEAGGRALLALAGRRPGGPPPYRALRILPRLQPMLSLGTACWGSHLAISLHPSAVFWPFTGPVRAHRRALARAGQGRGRRSRGGALRRPLPLVSGCRPALCFFSLWHGACGDEHAPGWAQQSFGFDSGPLGHRPPAVVCAGGVRRPSRAPFLIPPPAPKGTPPPPEIEAKSL